jgi:hypothetical protein
MDMGVQVPPRALPFGTETRFSDPPDGLTPPGGFVRTGPEPDGETSEARTSQPPRSSASDRSPAGRVAAAAGSSGHTQSGSRPVAGPVIDDPRSPGRSDRSEGYAGGSAAVSHVASDGAGTLADVTSNHGFRAQLDRARHLQATQAATAVRDSEVTPLPSKVAQVRARTLELRLPDPIPATSLRTGKLVSGRVRLPDDQRALLGWDAGTELVVSPHGPQLVLVEAGPASAAVGAHLEVDVRGRLSLSAGQRQLLGVSSNGHVAMLADPATASLRLVDPARLHALLAELTPFNVEPSDTVPPPENHNVVTLTRNRS